MKGKTFPPGRSRLKLFHSLTGESALCALLLLTAVLGLLAKAYSGWGRYPVNNLFGGFFYVVFWSLAASLLFPKARAGAVAVAVFGVTAALEFSQLSRAPLLEWIRSCRLGRALVGSYFDWWDFPFYALGAFAAWYLIRRFRR